MAGEWLLEPFYSHIPDPIMQPENTMQRRSFIHASMAAGVQLTSASRAFAQAYPAKPVRVVVPFSPGSATDTMTRLISDRLATALGQPVLIENRAGAGGTIGTAAVAKGVADGYTLLTVSAGHAVNHVLYQNPGYDTIKDFAGIAPLAGLPSVLVVSPALGIKTARDLVAAAKAKPGSFNYATAGVGSGAHISAEKFRMAAGIDAVHVPFKGSPESLTETMGGRTQFTWTPISTAAGHIKEGRLLALAVSTPKRAPAFPMCRRLPRPAFRMRNLISGSAFLRRQPHRATLSAVSTAKSARSCKARSCARASKPWARCRC